MRIQYWGLKGWSASHLREPCLAFYPSTKLNECNFSNTTRNERTSHFCKELSCKVILTYMRILLDLVRNVNYHILRECRLQISHLSGLFLLFLSLKTKIKLQQANMTANESMQRLKTGWAWDSQTHTRLVDSLFCITFTLKNNAFSVLHYVINVTLQTYVTSLRDSFCLGTFACGFFRLPPCSLTSSWGCLLAMKPNTGIIT